MYPIFQQIAYTILKKWQDSRLQKAIALKQMSDKKDSAMLRHIINYHYHINYQTI